MTNRLYYGDNLDWLSNEKAFPDESVDLVYLDPPFNSNATYSQLFKSPDGKTADSQIEAFEDTWNWGTSAEAAYDRVLKGHNTDVAQLLQAMRGFLHDNALMAYLAMMAARLVELHRVLKPTGSLYLHCDPTASHYLKLLLDGVFGTKSFRNVILFYAKGKNQTFHMPKTEWTREDLEKSRKQKIHVDENGVEWIWMPGGKGNSKNKMRRVDEIIEGGKAISDVWQIPIISSSSKERLGYPTQKPLALLERIINASSNPGDVVLDPFCGCGTAVHAAEKLGRRWLGIDITHLSIALIEKRMKDAFPGIAFEVEGRPKDLDSAQELASRDKHEFQKWAVTHIGGQPWKGGKKGPDGGIDGLIFFNGARRIPSKFVKDDFDVEMTHEKAIISVKGGLNKNVNDVASLVETIGRENAALGILLAAARPTTQMKARAAAAGFYDPGTGTPVPRIQIITLEELFAGNRPVIPNVNPAMFKAAPVEAKQQGKLF